MRFKIHTLMLKMSIPSEHHCLKWNCLNGYITSRDRPKSSPYPRLKNSKRTSKCQFTVLENRKTKKRTEWLAKRGTLPKLSTFLSQLKGTLWRKNKLSKKVSQCRKTERVVPLGFLNTQSGVKYQRN